MEPKVIDRLAKEISGFPSVEKIILFGSRARGDHTPYSDIDLAVTGVESEQEWARLRQKADVEHSGTLLKIDLLRLEKADTALQASIRKEGKILYERG